MFETAYAIVYICWAVLIDQFMKGIIIPDQQLADFNNTLQFA